MAEDLPGLGSRGDTFWCEHDPDSPGPDRCRYRLLPGAADVAMQASNLPDLFKRIAPRILNLTDCHFLNFSLHDERQNCMITHYWTKSEESGEFDGFPVNDCATGWVWKNQEAMFIPDIEQEIRFQACIPALRKHGVRSYSVAPMTTTEGRLGSLGLGKKQPEALDAEDMAFLSRAAHMVAVALQNQKLRWAMEDRCRRLQSLVAIAQELNSNLGLDRWLPAIFAELRQIAPCDYAAIGILEDGGLRRYAVSWGPGLESQQEDKYGRLSLSEATAEKAIETRSITYWTAQDLQQMATPGARAILDAGIQFLCNVPLISNGEVLGALHLGTLRRNPLVMDNSEYLQQVANQIAAALCNARTYDEMVRLKDRLAGEKRYLENEITDETHASGNIVGNSPLLKRVLDQASIVAPTGSTVLITGETGTGKERVARLIHSMSRRKDHAFVKLNCAAIPTGLLESELFGHEKGAFTGAISQKIGRMELAAKGTLFLDEIGEIPLELQPKLLRVLQDQEFERLGSTRTIQVDVRIIAATNRELNRAVEDKEFRSDLFYRLHVFPLHLPALRERSEDIPLLIRHFVEKFSSRLSRRVDFIPDEAIDAMFKWTWPGNIRELENFIERSVILSAGRVLRPPLSELQQEISRHHTPAGTTLREREREHIIEVLRQTRGVLSGPTGAASRLGLKRTTLQCKMQKLGISRMEYLD